MEFENFADIKSKRSDIFESRVEEAQINKDKGNEFYKENDLFNAEYFYHVSLYHIDFDHLQFNFELMDNHREIVLKVKNPTCLNLAAVRIKLKNYSKAVDLCNEVLKEEKNNVKALYRKAQALKEMKNYDSALEAITKAEEIEKDAAIVALRVEIKKLLRIENEKFKKMWRGKLIPKMRSFSLQKLLAYFNPFNLHFRLFPLVI